MAQTIELYSSDDLAVFDYRCTGAITGRDVEELATEHSVVVPRSGTFVRHDAAGSFVADSNQAVFFHKGTPFQVSHPVRGGDLCTVFAPSPRLHAELMRWHGPADDADAEASFPFDWLPLRGQPHLRQRILFRTLEAGGQLAPLEFEERVLDFLGEVVGQAYLTAGRAGGRHPADGSPGARELTHQAKLVLGERMKSKIALSEVASVVHCSPYYLSRVFRGEAGVHLHSYLNRLRLRASLEFLLRFPKETLSEIALEHGFSSHSHFARAFHDEFGVPPSALTLDPRATHLRELRKILIAQTPS